LRGEESVSPSKPIPVPLTTVLSPLREKWGAWRGEEEEEDEVFCFFLGDMQIFDAGMGRDFAPADA
jgi:hypothetical protein